jgi:hypothetical protein
MDDEIKIGEIENDAIALTLYFPSDEFQKMKSILEEYDKRKMDEYDVMPKLMYWAYKAIRLNIHSIDLQNKLKP